ncbi:flavodoxin domain-containing protein [Streptomyces sp. NBC_00377]|uniref:flavodoxin domain-containing protein n=1 Tax=unclassified Streptomyces TaxID=2593676 RepID=UPI002E1E282E|nr:MULTISPECIES: flavodoxin domain-containing protein [unclassified Streptomyces]
MTDTVLVTYGTTNGSTAEIAEAVADVLRKGGLTVESCPARSVRSVARYDAVVVGGALYAGRWHKEARRFVRRHRTELAERPVWFFSSGPLDASASERDIPPVRGVRHAMTRLDVREHVTFGGRLEEGAEGRVAGMILRAGKGGDFRDFGAIETWAKGVAEALTRRSAEPERAGARPGAHGDGSR